MILYYEILAPFKSFGIGGKDNIKTPDGIFYSHGVRDHSVDATRLAKAMNEGRSSTSRPFRVASFGSEGFIKWIL